MGLGKAQGFKWVWAKPKVLKEQTRQFLGLLFYYRKIAKKSAALAVGCTN